MNGPMCKSNARLDGKVVIVTGANTGIGRETALDLVQRGGKVYLACRSESKCQKAVDYIVEEAKADKSRVIPLVLDLGSKRSIRAFVNNFSGRESKLDILINNAGVAWIPEYTTTEDGFETTFGVNHLGHFLLTSLLIPQLLEANPSRIVTVSGKIHEYFKFEVGLMNEKNYSMLQSYPKSKAANVLFSLELGHRLKGHGVTTYSLHPGVITTEILRNFPFYNNAVLETVISTVVWPFVKSLTHGAQTSVCCAVDEKLAVETGKYYSDCARITPSEGVQSEDNAKALWDFSVALLDLQSAELHPLLR